jgi:hypothetical protein
MVFNFLTAYEIACSYIPHLKEEDLAEVNHLNTKLEEKLEPYAPLCDKDEKDLVNIVHKGMKSRKSITIDRLYEATYGEIALKVALQREPQHPVFKYGYADIDLISGHHLSIPSSVFVKLEDALDISYNYLGENELLGPVTLDYDNQVFTITGLSFYMPLAMCNAGKLQRTEIKDALCNRDNEKLVKLEEQGNFSRLLYPYSRQLLVQASDNDITAFIKSDEFSHWLDNCSLASSRTGVMGLKPWDGVQGFGMAQTGIHTHPKNLRDFSGPSAEIIDFEEIDPGIPFCAAFVTARYRGNTRLSVWGKTPDNLYFIDRLDVSSR